MNASQTLPVLGAEPVSPERRFPTGRGQNHTHDLTLNDGRPNPAPHAGKPYATLTVSDIVAMVENPPPAVPKDRAQWFIPSAYSGFDARRGEAQQERGSFSWLTLDVDKNNLPKGEIIEALTAVLGDCRFLIYSTSSATPDSRKWRALVPLKNPLAGADFRDTQEAFFDLLADATLGTLIGDAPLRNPNQLVYLPNPRSGLENYDKHIVREAPRLDLSPSHPVILRRDESRAKRAEAERAAEARRKQREAERAARPFGQGETPIEAFNARHSVGDLLTRYGYTRAGGGNDWRSRYQTGKSFATRDMGHYWVSLSGSDANAGLGHQTRSGARHGDAFDLYCHYDHGGDVSKAARAFMAELNPQGFVWPQGGGHATPGPQRTRTGPHSAEEDPPQGDESDDLPEPQEASPGATMSPPGGEMPEPVKGPRGKAIWCAENACLILEHHPAWAGALAHDEFNSLDMLLAPVPGSTAPRTSFRPRPLAATDVTAALRWFNRNGFPDATRNVVEDALKAVAAQSIMSPVRHYLEALTWDGKARISTWLQAYCQAPKTDLVGRFGRAWLIAAVARALRPGCKADNALVLEGAQGAGKSSALRALAGEEWFFDGLRDMHGKDASAGLRGKWIIELPELSALRRSDAEAVKAFLSRTEERYRPAYGKFEVVEPRRCVFAGTTNRGDYLADDTGGRRFWPVPVGRVDLEGLKTDRDQIWAEAVQAFRDGEAWWLDAGQEAAAAELVAERQAEDAWSGKVLAAVAGLREVSTAQVFELLSVPFERQGRAESMRIGGILARAGWEKGGKFKGGPYKDTTRYTPPANGGAA